MPVIKSAIKKLRQDKKREDQNRSLEIKASQALRNAKKKATGKAVSEAISMVDKLTKKNIIHKNKASRMKSTLSKIAKPQSNKEPKKTSDSKTISKKKITSKASK